MHWVIAYDIEGDAARARVAAILERNGQRVQRSVFECRLDSAEIEILWHALAGALSGSEGDIRFYRLCRDCVEEAFGLGDLVKTVRSGPCVIV